MQATFRKLCQGNMDKLIALFGEDGQYWKALEGGSKYFID